MEVGWFYPPTPMQASRHSCLVRRRDIIAPCSPKLDSGMKGCPIQRALVAVTQEKPPWKWAHPDFPAEPRKQSECLS